MPWERNGQGLSLSLSFDGGNPSIHTVVGLVRITIRGRIYIFPVILEA